MGVLTACFAVPTGFYPLLLPIQFTRAGFQTMQASCQPHTCSCRSTAGSSGFHTLLPSGLSSSRMPRSTRVSSRTLQLQLGDGSMRTNSQS